MTSPNCEMIVILENVTNPSRPNASGETCQGVNPLAGTNLLLRPRHEDDVAVLHRELYDDISTRARADSRPWIPIPERATALSPYAVESISDEVSFFSIASTERELAGEALLWGIDLHNRSAHAGLALLPRFRGRGWSAEVLQLLCRYAFVVRGLNRLQIETNPDNVPMIRAAERVGFSQEGVLRQATWTLGSFADAVVMGLLAKDWRDAKTEARP
jgi:RimJ/RimL family protein N-acetyltransferase